jgi:methionyl-tRNA formyltransferase
VLGLSESGLYVQCGEGVIEILEMQKPGGKKISAAQCISGGLSTQSLMRFEKLTNKQGGINV